MTRSEPPAEVIEAPDIVEKMRHEAAIARELGFSVGFLEEAADEIERLKLLAETFERQYRQACMDHAGILAEVKTLRASSSLGGIEGGVARPQTASAPQVLDIVRRPPAIIDDREARQKSVHEWCSAAFGAEAASSVAQRGVRLLEEAIELYQAAGCERTMGHLLIDFVFDRPKGKLAKEIGQVGLVLLSMAEAAGVSADEEEVKEVFRVREKPLSHYAARNQAKNAAGFNTAGAELAGAEQDTRNRVELSPSSARERRMEEALKQIEALHGDFWSGPETWQSYLRKTGKLAREALEPLSSDGRGREKGNTSNSDDGIDPSPPASNRSES